MVSSDTFLVHFNQKIIVLLSTDSSEVCIAVCLSHVFAEGQDRPLASASRTHTKSEIKIFVYRYVGNLFRGSKIRTIFNGTEV